MLNLGYEAHSETNLGVFGCPVHLFSTIPFIMVCFLKGFLSHSSETTKSCVFLNYYFPWTFLLQETHLREWPHFSESWWKTNVKQNTERRMRALVLSCQQRRWLQQTSHTFGIKSLLSKLHSVKTYFCSLIFKNKFNNSTPKFQTSRLRKEEERTPFKMETPHNTRLV